MDEERIERNGLQPLQDMLKNLGGWPVLEENWDETSFSWIDSTYKFRRNGYSTDYLIDFSVVTDSKNSSWRLIDIDQEQVLFIPLIVLFIPLIVLRLSLFVHPYLTLENLFYLSNFYFSKPSHP